MARLIKKANFWPKMNIFSPKMALSHQNDQNKFRKTILVRLIESVILSHHMPL